ncbi:MAG: N-acylglucosamine-6-phosphate 2-epimerase [Erysipelotrichaceae bacterium]|nr:N-acylglucosamine-6-phosphate 2-epimerase [Erysipelotrichaceae bacterium]
MKQAVERLMGGLIVSCQAYDDTPFYGPQYMQKFAQCAQMGGARGLRACWPQDVAAVRAVTDLPIIGINKDMLNDQDHEAFFKRLIITPTLESASEVIDAGADIVAVESVETDFCSYQQLTDLLGSIRDKYPHIAIMADLITPETGVKLARDGLVDILSTTLSAFDPRKKDLRGPDYEMIRFLKENTGLPVNAEGHVWEAHEYVSCLEAGADMVTIGSAITRPHLITRHFVDAGEKWLSSRTE